jgi:hypothetical protein
LAVSSKPASWGQGSGGWSPVRPRRSIAIRLRKSSTSCWRERGEEVLTLEPRASLLIDPGDVRQLFNDTDSDQLWLVAGAPREAVTSTLEMSDELLEFMYPDGPKAMPPELD